MTRDEAGNCRQYTWARTARVYRALYRQVAGLPLFDDDRQWLAA
jgi:hypothetical protein